MCSVRCVEGVSGPIHITPCREGGGTQNSKGFTPSIGILGLSRRWRLASLTHHISLCGYTEPQPNSPPTVRPTLMIPHLFLSLYELQAQQSGTISMSTVPTPNKHSHKHCMHLGARLSKALYNVVLFPLLQKSQGLFCKNSVQSLSAFPFEEKKKKTTQVPAYKSTLQCRGSHMLPCYIPAAGTCSTWDVFKHQEKSMIFFNNRLEVSRHTLHMGNKRYAASSLVVLKLERSSESLYSLIAITPGFPMQYTELGTEN